MGGEGSKGVLWTGCILLVNMMVWVPMTAIFVAVFVWANWGDVLSIFPGTASESVKKTKRETKNAPVKHLSVEDDGACASLVLGMAVVSIWALM